MNCAAFAQETPETCFESKSVEGNFATIAKVPANRTFGFIVVGLKNGEPVAVSDTAWATTGRVSATQGERRSVWHHYFPLSGRVPMQAVGHAEYFDNSTRAGKAAFHMIWNFFYSRHYRLAVLLHQAPAPGRHFSFGIGPRHPLEIRLRLLL